MPTLTVEDLPPQLFDRLVRRASEARRTVSDEAKQILTDSLIRVASMPDRARLPELIPSEEISPPCDLPLSAPATPVKFRQVDPPLPDPLSVNE